MAIEIDVEQFCILKANQAKLSDGHSAKRCPQCQGLRKLAVLVNNETLDMIATVFKRTNPKVVMSPQDCATQIEALKTVQ